MPYDDSMICDSLLEALKDCPQDAKLCGEPVVQVLDTVISSLTTSKPNLENTAQRCIMLKEQANDTIATYPYAEVPDHWRRLYMDATLLYVITNLMMLRGRECDLDDQKLLELVKLLDYANIITGYFDRGRREILFSLLAEVQSLFVPLPHNPTRHSSLHSIDDSERPTKKARVSDKGNSPATSSFDDSAILLPNIRLIKRYTLHTAPDMTELASRSEPFIITGAVSDWPALSSSPENTWSSSSYLRRIAGRGRIVPVEIGSSYTAQGWTQKMMPFEEFLDLIRWDDEEARKPPATANATTDTLSTLQTDEQQGSPAAEQEDDIHYLAQHDVFQQFPQLLADIITPDYVFSDPGPPEHYPEYKPPSADAGYIINAWMGPKGTYSPAHTDPYYNCYAQVVGSKHIWIAPPVCDLSLAEVNTSREESDDADSEEQVGAAVEQYMDNTTHIDVFKVSRLAGTDTANIPERMRPFVQEVLPKASQAILKEGDMLFMPPKWWHSLKSLERSFSVSMWF